MSKGTDSNDLQEIITQAIEKMKKEQGSGFDIQKINLAELERRTGITRAKLRKLQKDGFVVKPHALSGRKAEKTVLTGFTGVIDDLLRKGVSNAVVCNDRIVELGYRGSLTTVKVYIENHKHLIPPKRQVVSPQGNRGRRYTMGPGEAYQMDWGFVDVETDTGVTYRVACFAMICHHCGQRFIEFFPNAKQEILDLLYLSSKSGAIPFTSLYIASTIGKAFVFFSQSSTDQSMPLYRRMLPFWLL